MNTTMEFKWTVSRGRDTYGYNICSLYVDRHKVTACRGGGYDMKGVVLGSFIAARYAHRLLALKPEDMPENSYYGLTFHDPHFNPGQAVVEEKPTFGDEADAGKTVEQLEAEGKSLGLERYQAFHRASSRVPTQNHTLPRIDGACGFSSVEKIMRAIGLSLEYIPTCSKNQELFILHDTETEARGDD